MKQNWVLFVLFVALLFSSCADTGPSGSIAEEQPVVEQQMPIRKNRSIEREENLSSPMACALSKKDYSMWGILCQRSSHSKRLAQSNYHLISPSNEALSTFGVDVVSLLKYPENLDMLDELVGLHILEISADEQMADLASVSEKVESTTGLILNEDKIKTSHGYFLGSTGCLKFPLTELEKRSKRRAVQK